jgi:hypothetical protein
MKSTRTLQFVCPLDLAEWLQLRASIDRISLSSIIRIALSEFQRRTEEAPIEEKEPSTPMGKARARIRALVSQGKIDPGAFSDQRLIECVSEIPDDEWRPNHYILRATGYLDKEVSV